MPSSTEGTLQLCRQVKEERKKKVFPDLKAYNRAVTIISSYEEREKEEKVIVWPDVN